MQTICSRRYSVYQQTEEPQIHQLDEKHEFKSEETLPEVSGGWKLRKEQHPVGDR